MNHVAEARRLSLDAIGQRYRTLRLCRPAAVARMETSLRRHGQIAPVVVCPTAEDSFELIDGFKRLAAARAIDDITTFRPPDPVEFAVRPKTPG